MPGGDQLMNVICLHVRSLPAAHSLHKKGKIGRPYFCVDRTSSVLPSHAIAALSSVRTGSDQLRCFTAIIPSTWCQQARACLAWTVAEIPEITTDSAHAVLRGRVLKDGQRGQFQVSPIKHRPADGSSGERHRSARPCAIIRRCVTKSGPSRSPASCTATTPITA